MEVLLVAPRGTAFETDRLESKLLFKANCEKSISNLPLYPNPGLPCDQVQVNCSL